MSIDVTLSMTGPGQICLKALLSCFLMVGSGDPSSTAAKLCTGATVTVMRPSEFASCVEKESVPATPGDGGGDVERYAAYKRSPCSSTLQASMWLRTSQEGRGTE